MSKVEQYITSIPDFPKEGIIFRDITTVLGDADGFHLAVDEMTALLDGVEFDAIAGLESRGFLFGAPMAYNLHKAFIPIRKQGKLPRATSRMSYELEYGMETIEVHRDDIKPGMKIVVVDDLIATGGTLEADAKGDGADIQVLVLDHIVSLVYFQTCNHNLFPLPNQIRCIFVKISSRWHLMLTPIPVPISSRPEAISSNETLAPLPSTIIIMLKYS